MSSSSDEWRRHSWSQAQDPDDGRLSPCSPRFLLALYPSVGVTHIVHSSPCGPSQDRVLETKDRHWPRRAERSIPPTAVVVRALDRLLAIPLLRGPSAGYKRQSSKVRPKSPLTPSPRPDLAGQPLPPASSFSIATTLVLTGGKRIRRPVQRQARSSFLHPLTLAETSYDTLRTATR